MTKTEYNKSSTKSKLEKPLKIYPAFTTIRVQGGWAFVQITMDENFDILSSEVSQPDAKAIITERFKIAVGKYWQKIDEQTV